MPKRTARIVEEVSLRILGTLFLAVLGTGCTLTFNYNQCSEDAQCKEMYGDSQPFCTSESVCVKDPPAPRLCTQVYPEKPAANAVPVGAMMFEAAKGDDASDVQRINAIKIGVDELNEQAQFNKSLRPVVVYFCDVAKANNKIDYENMFKYLVQQRKVVGVIGPTTSEGVNDVVTVAASLETPVISPSATSASISKLPDQGFIFRVAPVEDLQATPVAKEVPSNTSQMPHALTIISVQSDYGEGVRQNFQAEWNKRNVNNVPRATPTYPNSLDPMASGKVTGISTGIVMQEAVPDSILLVVSPRVHKHTLSFLRELRTLKSYTPPATPTKIWLTDGGKGLDLIDLAVDLSIPKQMFDNLEGVSPMTFDRDSKTFQIQPTAADFRNAWQARYKDFNALDNDLYVAYTYDAFYALALALESIMGEVTGAKVATALQQFKSTEKVFNIGQGSFASFNNAAANLRVGSEISMRGVTGVIRFSADGDREPALFDRWNVEITETGMEGNKMRTAKLVSRPFVTTGM